MYEAADVNTSMFGYIPNSPANIAAASIFAVIFFTQVPLGIVYREWWLLVTWGITAALEILCYDARSVGHEQPTWLSMYEMQMVCSVIAPSFMAAGLYNQLSKEVEIFGHHYSPVRPRLYSAFFITVDVIGLLVQAAGGGLSAQGHGNKSDYGRWMMVGGIAFQVVFLLAFAVIFTIVNYRIFRDDSRNWSPKYATNRMRPLFKFWVPAVATSLLFLITRSIYRVIELSDGWNGRLMRTERYFLVCDGLMIVLGMIPLTVIYPGMAYGKVSISKSWKKSDGEETQLSRYDSDQQGLVEEK